ncbi:hypothetical protein HN51_049218 [Arachis hypogaea]
MDGSLSTLLNPDQFRRNCFTQYRDMKSMDPAELLGILPTCHFGRFCSNKYLSIVHPKMEESCLAIWSSRVKSVEETIQGQSFKAVLLLHLVAVSLKLAPSHFEASPGAEFHKEYMQCGEIFRLESTTWICCRLSC